ncbi:hypothetical protein [Rhodococcus sp. WAY2]|uniref:hypothetical protein n=1 Tax=Rhodococcus sp. WAY2 TaxID=2663121 RepID=UPI00135B25F9|nr:hypothetical protein [Rhodococcus sp. WAY2]
MVAIVVCAALTGKRSDSPAMNTFHLVLCEQGGREFRLSYQPIVRHHMLAPQKPEFRRCGGRMTA